MKGLGVFDNLNCDTCTAAQKKERGCVAPPVAYLLENDGSKSRVEWSIVELHKQGTERGLIPDEELAGYLYPLANLGFIHEHLGMFWDFCPRAFLAPFNDTEALWVARAASENAYWIRLGAPHLAFDGEKPTPKMEFLTKLALTYLQDHFIRNAKKPTDGDTP